VEFSLGSALSFQVTALSSSTAVATDTERSRAMASESSLAVALSGLVNTETQRASTAESALSSAIATEKTRIQQINASLIGVSASLATGLNAEATRALAAELSESTRATGAETAIRSSISQAFSTLVVQASQATALGNTDTSMAVSVSREASRATAAEVSVASSAAAVDASISQALLQEASRAITSEFSLSVFDTPGAQLVAQEFHCRPGAWSTAVNGLTAGCSTTISLNGPSIVVAMFAGHVMVATTSNWQYTSISLNGDFDLTVDPCCTMPGVAINAPAHTYSKTWESQRTARVKYFNGGTVTIAARFLGSTVSTTNGYAVHGIAITNPSYMNFLSAANSFQCASTTWQTNIPTNSRFAACSSTFFLPYPSFVYSFFGGHEQQSSASSGAYGMVAYDNDALGPQSNYGAYCAAYSTDVLWESYSSGRVSTMQKGLRNASMSFYAPTTTANAFFNGGGLSGFYLPLDLSITVPQTFSCSVAGATSVGASVVTVCSTTFTLPYRAVVWAEFTSNLVSPALGWTYGVISFDNDAQAILAATNTADLNFLALGPAHSYTSSPSTFGQGRSKTLAVGSHTVSVQLLANTASGTVSALGLTGYFVRAA